ncbi:MAG: ParB/RepB/Spo0J family partition protein [Ghiorsea sp.]|nr:ParB/RepB/Spo0J family partition protein [Ghiorsea sp.]
MKTPQKKRRALGRGLNALLGDKPTPEVLAQSTLIPLTKITPNPYQPRSYFDPDELAMLTESIRRDGVLMPVLLRPQGDGYELIAGERRWRASKNAKLNVIPAVIRDVDNLQALELAIIENEQRNDLTTVESARAYRRLMDEFNYTQQQVADSVGVSRAQVSNLVRLLQLASPIQTMLEERQLSMGQARPLVGLDNALALNLAHLCVEKGLSARQMEKEVKKLASSAPKTNPKIEPNVVKLEEELASVLGLSVKLREKKNGAGEIKLTYQNKLEFNQLLQRLR